ncbi:hypothetical protein MMC28_010121 [Mycoblastus sanguinarius]|nr:hypothetical protein [Mycoblastus sanguinarius]
MDRYIDLTTLPFSQSADPRHELLSSLASIVTGYPPQSSWSKHDLHGLYSGPTSIAYLFLHLSNFQPSLLIENKAPGYWCRAYLQGTRPQIPVPPSCCGIGSELLAHLAVAAALTQDVVCVERFLAYLPTVINDDVGEDLGRDEWLYGRAGTLYLLRLMRYFTTTSKPALENAIQTLLDKILDNGPPWYWHEKNYLGGVHGSIGIIIQIILSAPAYAPKLQDLLNELLSAQNDKTGNWPSSSSTTSSGKDLGQFCHGAPGFVISLLAIRPHFPSTSTPTPTSILQKIDTVIAEGRECIYNLGLLTKSPCLCHGAVGNALAFEPGFESREAFMRC